MSYDHDLGMFVCIAYPPPPPSEPSPPQGAETGQDSSAPCPTCVLQECVDKLPPTCTTFVVFGYLKVCLNVEIRYIPGARILSAHLYFTEDAFYALVGIEVKEKSSWYYLLDSGYTIVARGLVVAQAYLIFKGVPLGEVRTRELEIMTSVPPYCGYWGR